MQQILVEMCNGDGEKLVPEEQGERWIAEGRAVLLHQAAHADSDPELWRFGLIHDFDSDSLVTATRYLARLHEKSKSSRKKLFDFSDLLKAEDFNSADDHRDTVRWLHRVGWFFIPHESPSEMLQNWLSRDDSRALITSGLEALQTIRFQLPDSGELPDSGLALVEEQLRPWIENIPHTPPLGHGSIRDFPETTPIDPWSPFRKWQYFSDAAYLAERFRNWFPQGKVNYLRPVEQDGKQRATLDENPRIRCSRKEWWGHWLAMNRRDRFSMDDYSWMSEELASAGAEISRIAKWILSTFESEVGEIMYYAQVKRDLPETWDRRKNQRHQTILPRHSIRPGEHKSLARFLSSELLYADMSLRKESGTEATRDRMRTVITSVQKTLREWGSEIERHETFEGDEPLMWSDNDNINSVCLLLLKQGRQLLRDIDSITSPRQNVTSDPSDATEETMPDWSDVLNVEFVSEDPPDDSTGIVRPQFGHSEDFASVTWNGVHYSFTPTQARCVSVLWNAWKAGTPGVFSGTVIERADVASERLDMVFRVKVEGKSRSHPAWGTMIVKGSTNSSFRLAGDPPDDLS